MVAQGKELELVCTGTVNINRRIYNFLLTTRYNVVLLIIRTTKNALYNTF